MNINNFEDLHLSFLTMKAIKDMNFDKPTTVQAESVPKIIEGKDLVVMAKTGSGKTLAYTIPMFEKIDENIKSPQALILVSTRELAVQVHKEITKIGKYHQLSNLCVYGQHNIQIEIDKLRQGRQIIVGTPGRVIDHIQRGTIKTEHLNYLVLDEADRMLDMGFIDQVMSIIHDLPKERNTQMFSATMPDPIVKLTKYYMNHPEMIKISSDTMTVDKIEQFYYRVEHNKKRTSLHLLLRDKKPKSAIIFANTRTEVDRICEYLDKKGYKVASLHGANTQSHRNRTLEKLKKGQVKILVATDVAARGLHIDNLELVINYDLPREIESYVHRIGRTGRAGKEGLALNLVTVDDVFTLYNIEEFIGRLIKEQQLPEYKKSEYKRSDYKKQNYDHKKSRNTSTKGSMPKSYSKQSQKELKEKLLKDQNTKITHLKGTKNQETIKRVSAPKKESIITKFINKFKK